jgi:hypothetical protein
MVFSGLTGRTVTANLAFEERTGGTMAIHELEPYKGKYNWQEAFRQPEIMRRTVEVRGV